MRKATIWLVVGLGGVGVGVAFALPVPGEAGVALVVLGIGITMFAAIERTIETRRTETETAQLDDKSRRLVEMIRSRRDRVWEGIRDQRYTKHEDGEIASPDVRAVFNEIEDIFREVAALYHADSHNAVFEARIGDIALAFRSAVGDLLELGDRVPFVDPAGWSLRKVMTRRDQIRRLLKLYRTLSPYRYHVKGAMIATRLALGANPISLAAWYVGSEVATRVGGQVLKSYVEARLKDPLERLVALVYLQAARTYDPRLAYRSADWVALVEVLRMHARISGIDHNRKLLLDRILRAQILDEFAKMALLRALAADREPDFQTIPLIDFALLHPEPRQEIADRLRDILAEMEGLNVPTVGEMIEDLECRLQCRIEVDVIRSGGPDFTNAKKGFMRDLVRSAKMLQWRRWRSGPRAPRRSRNAFTFIPKIWQRIAGFWP